MTDRSADEVIAEARSLLKCSDLYQRGVTHDQWARLLAALVDLVSRQPQEAIRCSVCDQEVPDNGDLVCVDCYDASRHELPDPVTLTMARDDCHALLGLLAQQKPEWIGKLRVRFFDALEAASKPEAASVSHQQEPPKQQRCEFWWQRRGECRKNTDVSPANWCGACKAAEDQQEPPKVTQVTLLAMAVLELQPWIDAARTKQGPGSHCIVPHELLVGLADALDRAKAEIPAAKTRQPEPEQPPAAPPDRHRS